MSEYRLFDVIQYSHHKRRNICYNKNYFLPLNVFMIALVFDAIFISLHKST